MARWLGGGLLVAALLGAGVVRPGMGKAAGLLFQAEAQTLTEACERRPVRLEGNHNTVSLSGTCASLLVKGVANTIRLTIAAHGLIHVEGSENQIRYAASGASPVIEILGPNNDVAAGSVVKPISDAPTPHPETPPPAAPRALAGSLALSGDDQERLADCDGHDVVVTGNRGSYIIRGQCHSLVVRGDLLTVQAVMRPGARISVAGRGSVVSWAIQGTGHPPASTVQGAGSHVQRAISIGGEPAP